jgi:hypothetical protein
MAKVLWRFGAGLIALPAQVIALFVVFHGAPEAVGHLYRRLHPVLGPTGPARMGARLFGGLVLGVPVAIVMNAAALVMAVTLVRSVWYPFWAFGAPAGDLRHSWGGPTPLGATGVHWFLGALILVGGDLVLRGGGYLQRLLVYRRAGSPPVPRPGSARVRPRG